MGNNQSQASDDEGVQRYNYHENILRDAQTSFTSSDTRPSEHADSDDQYVSAEESDSLHSLTPERTRPESSSNDSLTDCAENESTAEDMIKSEQLVSIGESSDLQSSAVTDKSINIIQTDVSPLEIPEQRRIGIIHGNSNVSSESENIAEKSSSCFTNPNGIPRSLLDLSFRKKSPLLQSSEDQTVRVSNPYQFVPIQPTDDLISNNTLQNEKSFAKLGKRKILQDSPEESVVARKRMLTRSSSKRKRLGYTDSSDSETGETEKEDSRKPRKRGKIIKLSPKKSRQVRRDSKERDSDERRYGKQKRTRKSRYSSESESVETGDETEDQSYIKSRSSRRNKSPNRHKRRHKNSSDESSDESDKTSRFRKKRKANRRQTKDTDSDEKRDKVESERKSYKSVSSQHDDTISLQSHESPVNLSGLEDTHNVTALSTSLTSASVVADASNRPCHTFKMGNQSLRNSHGKVFPLRHPSPKNLTSDPWKNNASVCSGLSTTETEFELRRSDNGNLGSPPLKVNKLLTENEPCKNVSITQRSQRESDEDLLRTGSHLVPESIDSSPFKNVVLTPPVINDMIQITQQQQQYPTITKLAARCDAGDHSSDMEVEESDVSIENQSVNQSLHFMPAHTRSFLQSRHKKKTVAARFKTFFTEKKKNIGENLKSLFSKVNSPSDKPLGSARPIWQTFTSISNNTHSALRNSQVKQPVTFFNRNDQNALSLISSLQNQAATKQQQFQRQQTFLSTAATAPHGQMRGYTSAVTTADPSVLKSGPQELPQMFSTRSSNPQPSALVASSSVELLPQSIQYQVFNFRLADAMDVSVSVGELADQKTAGIVNWTDGALTHSVTSCSKSVAAKAGALMRAACNDYIESKGSNLEAPDVLTTPAGGRFARTVEAILHVVEPSLVDGDETHNSRALMEVFANCLRFANERLALDSISFPLVGNEIFPFTVCVKSFYDAILIFLAEQSQICNLTHIQLVIPDIAAADLAADLIKSYLERVSYSGLESEASATFGQYFGHRLQEKQQNTDSQTRLDTSGSSSQSQNFTVERTTTGRPRLKRPRL